MSFLEVSDDFCRRIGIAINLENGKRLGTRSALQCGMTGGLLLDLALRGNIDKDIRNHVVLKDAQHTSHMLLNKTLERIVKAGKPRSMMHWVINLTVFKSNVVDSLIVNGMIQQGILKKETRACLGVFHKARFFPEKPDQRARLITKIKQVIKLPPKQDLHVTYLLGLLARSGLATYLLTPDEAKKAAANTKAIFSSIIEQRETDPIAAFYWSVLETITASLQPYAEG
jgi:hypothetical protein